MPSQHIVKSGDTLSGIAKKHGFSSWKDIYHAPENAAFRKKRPNPDKIFPGDVVVIPDGKTATPGGRFPPVVPCPFPGAGQGNAAPLGTPGPVSSIAPSNSPPSNFAFVSPRQAALARQASALQFVQAAIAGIERALDQGTVPGASKIPAVTEESKALTVHFKTERHINPLQQAQELRGTFVKILQVILRADEVFVDEIEELASSFAWAIPGGVAFPTHPRNGRIHFCPPFVPRGPLFQTVVIIHEAAHFVSRSILHVASELPAPKGTPVGSTKTYAAMTATEAMGNAYSYAQFALHMAVGFDKRIDPGAE